MSDSLLSHGLYSPWNSLAQNTGVGSLPLFQGIFPTQGSNPGLPHCGQILYQLSHRGSPRILEWVAYLFSRGSSWPRIHTRVSCTADRFFSNWAISEKPQAKHGFIQLSLTLIHYHVVHSSPPSPCLYVCGLYIIVTLFVIMINLAHNIHRLLISTYLLTVLYICSLFRLVNPHPCKKQLEDCI